jgi:hypothetical protein
MEKWRYSSIIVHSPAFLSSRKRPWFTLQRRLSEPQSRSGQCGKEKNILLLPGFTSGNPARNYALDIVIQFLCRQQFHFCSSLRSPIKFDSEAVSCLHLARSFLASFLDPKTCSHYVFRKSVNFDRTTGIITYETRVHFNPDTDYI